MSDYPEYVEVNGHRYKINTDFRYAIECQRIAQDDIGDLERALAVIYTLFGEEALNNPSDYEKLLIVAKKYLSCGKEEDINNNEEPDMDFIEDMDYIETSFQSDYGIKLEEEEMHWWKFFNLMNGLSNSEFGNCCILNRIRNLRTFDLKDITDVKQRDRIRREQERVALKRNKKSNKLTEEQENSMEQLNRILGI